MATFDFSGKTVIVTGGGSGIGRAICNRFAKAGANIQLLEIDSEAGKDAFDELDGKGDKSGFYHCNVADQSEVQGVMDQILETTGSIDILVNNAGIAHIGNVETTSEEDLDRIYKVNVKGVYNGMHTAVPKMVEQGGGVILNLASVASVVGIADRFAYSMSKGAVLTMTYSVAKDYVNKGIRCNCIAPGRVHTPFVDGFLKENYPDQVDEMFEKLSQTQPIGRMGKPEEIAALVVYLCSDEAGFITGTNVPIDGGFITLNT